MRHSLWVSPLISQGVWEDIVGNNPSTDIHRNFMVERVSWLDAVLFCNQLSEKLGYEPVYQTPEDIRYFLSQDKTSAIVKQVICDFNQKWISIKITNDLFDDSGSLILRNYRICFWCLVYELVLTFHSAGYKIKPHQPTHAFHHKIFIIIGTGILYHRFL